jgi:hypothetical protein
VGVPSPYFLPASNNGMGTPAPAQCPGTSARQGSSMIHGELGAGTPHMQDRESPESL